MKSLLSLTVAVFVLTPALFADDGKTSTKAKDACCDEKPKAAECSSAKGGCCAKDAAARQALLTHKGAYIAQR